VSRASLTLLPQEWGQTLDINFLGDICAKGATAREKGHEGSSAIRACQGFPALTLDIYGPQIPPGLLSAAESSVDTPFECLAYVRAFRPEVVPSLRHAVVRSGRQIVAIFSFYTSKASLVVVNRLIRLPNDVLAASAAQMLQQYPYARSVEFNDLYTVASDGHSEGIRSLSWPAVDCAEVDLPGSYDEYLQHFGSTTRKNLRYCARRLERESPDIAFRILRGEEIADAVVKEVVDLNHLRMASKGKASGMDESYASRLAVLSRSHGVACIATDGSRIVGGTLCTEVGAGWTLHVIAHDPNYNHVRLGLLCLLESVAEAIRGRARRFNFLWGASDYKLLFGAKIGTLQTRRYYRSLGCQLLALRDIRDCVVQSTRHRISLWRQAHRRTARKQR
jgi:Acetyltransferase (GNAT) domain